MDCLSHWNKSLTKILLQKSCELIKMKLTQDQIRMLIKESKEYECETPECCVHLQAIAELPSQFGSFQICALVSPCDGKEHTTIIKGDIINQENVLTRVHSECLTGDVMGSRRCDCREQLIESLKRIENEGKGVLLYLRQEGRNIGLTNKLKAYAIQDLGLDTYDANAVLGFQPDERDYGIAANILRTLKVKSIRLLTNNPKKIRELTAHGIKINERVPLIITPTEHNRDYLKTKKEKAGHLLGNASTIHSIDEIKENF
jgi:GTP cyclohydrolase II